VLRSVRPTFIGKPPLRTTYYFYQQKGEFGKPCPENYWDKFKSWQKTQIDEQVLKMLFDAANVPPEKVLSTVNARSISSLIWQTICSWTTETDSVYKTTFKRCSSSVSPSKDCTRETSDLAVKSQTGLLLNWRNSNVLNTNINHQLNCMTIKLLFPGDYRKSLNVSVVKQLLSLNYSTDDFTCYLVADHTATAYLLVRSTMKLNENTCYSIQNAHARLFANYLFIESIPCSIQPIDQSDMVNSLNDDLNNLIIVSTIEYTS
jgi:hypothetical protein